MSCITKILELKGDKEFIASHSQSGVEGGGVYKGYEYIISFTSLGHRCGYVAIADGVIGEYEDLYVHGGITFQDNEHGFKSLLDKPCSDLWIGFDAAHCDDLGNLDTAMKYFGHLPEAKRSIEALKSITEESYRSLADLGCIHRTYEYMEDQCKYLIDQIIERKAA
jgi:hypothetical protein